MEARRKIGAPVVGAILVLVVVAGSPGPRCPAASCSSPNFVIETPDPAMAREFSQAAERLRRELAISWLGEELPPWSAPCPVTIRVGPSLGAGGATSFLFDRGEVYGWRMTIQGSRQRVLDSVLPHEITHMLLASELRQAIPRWADEGAATSVECQSERTRHHEMLLEFLRSNQGIAFNQMFRMTEYPRDNPMPLYAQGYALAEYLIQQGGRQKYVEYLADGLSDGQWARATREHYGYTDLGVLQNAWVGWVGSGFPRVERPSVYAVSHVNDQPKGLPRAEALADARRPRPLPNLIHRIEKEPATASMRDDGWYAADGPRAIRPTPREPRPLPGPAQSQLSRPLPRRQSGETVLR